MDEIVFLNQKGNFSPLVGFTLLQIEIGGDVMEISVFWIFIGIILWPELTLCIILWMLGYPILGIIALIFASTTSVKTIIREKIIDQTTGRVISESEREG